MPKATLKKNIMAIIIASSLIHLFKTWQASYIFSTLTLLMYKMEKQMILFLPVAMSPPYGIALDPPQ